MPGTNASNNLWYANQLAEIKRNLAAVMAPKWRQPELVTALPESPIDGQEVFYLADATNGVTWHLRYRAGSESAHKWEFVGGSQLLAATPNEEATVTGAAESQQLVKGGPALTLPLPGDYDASAAMMLIDAGAENFVSVYPTVSATGARTEPERLQGQVQTAGKQVPVTSHGRLTSVAAGAELRIGVQSFLGTHTITFYGTTITAVPVRVG